MFLRCSLVPLALFSCSLISISIVGSFFMPCMSLRNVSCYKWRKCAFVSILNSMSNSCRVCIIPANVLKASEIRFIAIFTVLYVCLDLNVSWFVRNRYIRFGVYFLSIINSQHLASHLRWSLRPPSRRSEGTGSCPPVSPAQAAHCWCNLQKPLHYERPDHPPRASLST